MNVGSPPRTRGARAILDPRQPADGITPAYAGSTPEGSASPGRCRDHPRVRGEHRRGPDRASGQPGSPPRTRGALRQRYAVVDAGRITPAYAGSTRARRVRPPLNPDHPRVRGEHDPFRLSAEQINGSPPRTRGAPWVSWVRAHDRRITPAYAGSTSPRSMTVEHPSDHPRVRGEHRLMSVIGVSSVGSPPRTRGARRQLWRPHGEHRITPAYAGSTLAVSAWVLWRADHPRVRGEHKSWSSSTTPCTGSPPRTRGAHGVARGGGLPQRITPAYAGSTHSWRGSMHTPSDHPRVRGEHVPISAAACTSRDHPRVRGEHRHQTLKPPPFPGSPPRTRGARIINCVF